jgi:hypothetical protein
MPRVQLQLTSSEKKIAFIFGMELGSTRTGNFMCRRAVPAGFWKFPSVSGGFQYDYE